MEVDAGRPHREPVSRYVRLILVLLLPIALAAGLWLWQSQELADAEAARADDRDAVNAATRATLAWASVDHRRADDYVETVRSMATGEFLAQFEESETALRQLLKDNRSIQVPTIPIDGAALLERRDDQARVLIAMDASVTNKRTKTPQPRQYRLQVTLTEEDGEWLVSGMEFIDAES